MSATCGRAQAARAPHPASGRKGKCQAHRSVRIKYLNLGSPPVIIKVGFLLRLILIPNLRWVVFFNDSRTAKLQQLAVKRKVLPWLL